MRQQNFAVMFTILDTRLLGLDDAALPLPGDGGRRLAPEPDVVAEGVPLLDLDIVHAGLVDKRLH